MLRTLKMLVGCCALWVGLALADDTRVLHLVVPYPSGGVLDFQARLIAPALRRQLQREVVVDNRAGAAGAIALQRATAVLDGSEIVVGSDSDAVVAPLFNTELKYTPDQFQVLAVVGVAPMGLFARPGFDGAALWRSQHQAARPDSALRIASYGTGSNAHLVAHDFARQAGLAWLHVPYRGVAPLLQDLMGGTVDLAFLPVAAGIPDLVRAGKLQLLGIAAPARGAGFPEVPTVAEQGLPGFVHVSWSALLAPRALPAPVAARLHAAAMAAAADPHVRSELAAAGVAALRLESGEQAEAFFQGEQARYRRLLGALVPGQGPGQ